jgi:chemotaxis protein histidine kinase CheA
MSRIPANLQEKWAVLQAKCYADQAIWVLNGFWHTLEKDAELVWTWSSKFGELDQENKAGGHDLDEFFSHKFLETLGQTMTVIEMREKFRQIDADFNKRMSLIEFLMFRFQLKVLDVINAPQGENKEEMAAAQAKVAAAQAAVDEVVRRLADSKAKTDASKAAADAADAVAAPYRAAVAENDAALKELQSQEKAYQDKKSDLERTKDDMSLGLVKRNQAANQLAQLMAEDPLPLRKAKINQTATVKKMEKAAAPFNEASAKAKAAAEEAAEAQHQVEVAVNQAEESLRQAMDFLEEVKRKGGVSYGSIWWLERTIIEKKKYMPESKQK